MCQKRRGVEHQTFVAVGAREMFNPREQQSSYSLALHARMDSHAPDV